MVEEGRLQNRYRLDERLASGGMGAVYAAHDERLGRKVAVKLLKEDLASDVRFVERFRREARAVASLSHPNIANVFDYGEEDDRHFIVMEFAEGADLAQILRQEGPLEPGRAAGLAAQVCAALAHAHAAGIVHRDVKPGNVIVAPGDGVKVTDFGIARAVGESTLTATGSVLGTAHYLSPEQASGGDVGPSSDVYSLGIVLYEMLTGSVPFTGDTPIAIAMRHVSDPLPRPSETNSEIPAAYDDIVARATAKDPNERFRDPDEMAAALSAARRGEAVREAAAAAPTAALGMAPIPTAELRRTEEEQTVWPIPGTRWQPHKIGRAVLIAFILLAVLAAALLFGRVLGGDDEPAAQSTQEETTTEDEASPEEPEPEPEGVLIDDSIIGMVFDDAKDRLEAQELKVKKEDVESEAAKDTVVDSNPAPGSRMQEGEEITLLVSKGPDDLEDEEDDKGKPDNPGEGKGKDKGKKD